MGHSKTGNVLVSECCGGLVAYALTFCQCVDNGLDILPALLPCSFSCTTIRHPSHTNKQVSQLWKDVVTKLGAAEYPDVELSHMYIDNAAMQLIRNPKYFDVIVTGALMLLGVCGYGLVGLCGDQVLVDCQAQLAREAGWQQASLSPSHSSVDTSLSLTPFTP